MRRFSVLLLCMLLLAASNDLYAKKRKRKSAKNKPAYLYTPSAYTVGDNGLQFSLDGSYFESMGQFDENGNEEPLTDEAGFTTMQSELTGRYGIGDGLEVRIGARYRTNTSTDSQGESLTATGVESYFGGAKYKLRPVGNFTYAFDFQFRKSAYNYSKYENGQLPPQDEIELGDVGTEITTGLHLAYKTSKTNFLSGFVGYRVPYDDLSEEVVGHVETAWAFTNFAMVFGVEGIYSLQTSDYSDAPEQRPSVNVGETRLYNSVNRSLIKPYVGINIASGSLALGLQAGSVVAGTWTDKGHEFLATLTYTKSGKAKKKSRIERFKEYDIEASIIKISPRKKFVKIDQGLSNDLAKGMRIDIFKTDFFGGNILVATGVVYQVGSDWSIVKILKRYRDIDIKVGFTARGH